MLSLYTHDITDLFVLVDETLPRTLPGRGRKPLMDVSELVTALLWNMLTVHSRTLKDVWIWLMLYHHRDFQVPHYSAFIDACQRALPELVWLLELFCAESPIEIVDSTVLPVCKNHRADAYRTLDSELVGWAYNHQGSFFGFKLHLACDLKQQICRVILTRGDVHDQTPLSVLRGRARLLIGDRHYGGKAIRQWLAKQGVLVIAPPQIKQTHQLMAQWQAFFLNLRPRIESIFDALKEHLGLVTSFPRSLKGYLVHYARVILGYQLQSI